MHAHLGAQHPEAVQFVERAKGMTYSLRCPICGSGYEQPIKAGWVDPAFVEEFQGEIRLVALDMLVHHLVGEHELTGQDEQDPNETPSRYRRAE